jgi:hypothetical protein
MRLAASTIDPENDLSQLTGILISAFDKAMVQAGPLLDYTDVIASAVRVLADDAAQARKKSGEARDLLTKVTAARKRLRFKGKGPDLIGRVLDERIRDVEAKIGQMEDAVRTIERAGEHLKLYGWDFDRSMSEGWTRASDVTTLNWR